MKRRAILQVLAVIAVIALLTLLSACTGKEEPKVRKVEKEVVKVGFIGPFTGGVASIGVPDRDAAMLAEEEINKNNLVPGKQFKLVYEDEQCDPKQSATAVQKLIVQDKVRAVIGSLCSGATLADAPIAEQNKVLLLSYGATNRAIKDAGDYIFRNTPSDKFQAAEDARLLQKLGAKKVAIIHVNNDWGAGLKDDFTEAAKTIGLSVVATETYDPAATDFRTQLTKIKEAKPDMIYMPAYPADTGLVLKQMRELGIVQQVVGADASKDDAVIATAGNAAEGLIVTLPGVPKSPELEKFAAAFKAKYGKEYSAYTPEAYDAVYILAKACAATDCSSTAMKDYLYSMGEYKGASGTYAFDKDGEVQKGYDLFTVKDSKWVPYMAEEEEEAVEEVEVKKEGEASA